MGRYRTDFPLLIDLAEVEFQTSLSRSTIEALVSLGELELVKVDDQVLITWDSLRDLVKRMRRNGGFQTKLQAGRLAAGGAR